MMNIITKIEVTKRNKERVSIFIDHEFAFAVSAEIIYKESLKVNDKVDLDKIKKIVEEDNYIKCKNTAFKTIERSYKTEKEIRDKLLSKEFDLSTVDKTINLLKEYNMLNDKTYVQMFVKDKIKAQGEKKIKFLLKQKGISEELIEKELSNISKDDLRETAYSLAQKKYKILKNREDDKYKISQKLFRFLGSKGYDIELIKSVIQEVMNTEIS